NPVERNRALRRNEAGKVGGSAKGEPRHVGPVLARRDYGEAVDVSRNDMAAELIADLERPFEVDTPAHPPMPGRGHVQGLGGRVGGEECAVAVFSTRHGGQAHAVAGDRSPDVDTFGSVAAGDGKANEILPARLDRNHLANIGNDAGEHYFALNAA